MGWNWPIPVRKLAARFLDGSGSMVGIPVADVVVVHVDVDIRRNRFGGTKRFPRYKQTTKTISSLTFIFIYFSIIIIILLLLLLSLLLLILLYYHLFLKCSYKYTNHHIVNKLNRIDFELIMSIKPTLSSQYSWNSVCRHRISCVSPLRASITNVKAG